MYNRTEAHAECPGFSINHESRNHAIMTAARRKITTMYLNIIIETSDARDGVSVEQGTENAKMRRDSTFKGADQSSFKECETERE